MTVDDFLHWAQYAVCDVELSMSMEANSLGIAANIRYSLDITNNVTGHNLAVAGDDLNKIMTFARYYMHETSGAALDVPKKDANARG